MAHVAEAYDKEKDCWIYTVTADSKSEVQDAIDIITREFESGVTCRVDIFPIESKDGKFVTHVDVTDLSGVAAKNIRYN